MHKDDGCVQGETIVEEATTNEVKKAERDFQTIRVPGSGAAVRAIIVLLLYNAMWTMLCWILETYGLLSRSS